MTNFNNLGWECPVCHLGNAPFSMTCGHCTRRWDQQTPRPTGEPIHCAFCKGLIYPGESHLCKTWERMVQGGSVQGRTLCPWCGKPAQPGHTCVQYKEALLGEPTPATVLQSHAYRPEKMFGLEKEPTTAALPSYNGEFTSPYQGTTTSRVFMVCPVCGLETGGSHACKGTGK